VVADPITGTETAAVESGQVAFLINWQTGDPRKGGKPRTYVSGVLDEETADPARVSSGTLAALNSGLATWLTDIAGRTIPTLLVEMSFVNACAYRLTPVTRAIFGGTVSPIVATQRRRVNRLRI